MQVDSAVFLKKWVGSFQKCRRNKDLHQAMCLHALMCEQHLDSHIILVNCLVPALVDCGSLSDARHVFDALPPDSWDRGSWNSLVSGYVQCGQPDPAFHLYHQMQNNPCVVQPDRVTYLTLLRACSRFKDIKRGHVLHAHVIQRGLERDIHDGSPIVGNTLLDMYSRCGLLGDALHVFEGLPTPNDVSWNVLITAYTGYGLFEEACGCFSRMQLDSVAPGHVTFLSILNACGEKQALEKGRQIHTEATKRAIEMELRVGSMLVDMYMRCGLSIEAHRAFKIMPVRDAVSWAVLLAGYADCGFFDAVSDCFIQMSLDAISPDSVTFICALKACSTTQAIETGWELHTEVVKRGLEIQSLVANSLLAMYIECGSLTEGHAVFHGLSDHDVVLWATLIAGYVEHGCIEEAGALYERMLMRNISPDATILVTRLKSCKMCGYSQTMNLGQKLHTLVTKMGWERELYIGSALIDMYNHNDLLAEGGYVFDRLQTRNIVSWNAYIAGFDAHGLAKGGRNFLKELFLHGICPDITTFTTILKACSNKELGRDAHAEVIKRGWESELHVGSALVNMYSECGLIAETCHIFSKLQHRDTFTWNAMIGGCTQYKCSVEALSCFQQMMLDHVPPDDTTFACVLKACPERISEIGSELHSEVVKRGFEGIFYVGHMLVAAYLDCSLIGEAFQTFDRLPLQNALTWNALVAGYTEHGFNDEAGGCFQQMLRDGISPNCVTFVCNLKACGLIGTLQAGQEVHSESVKYGLERELYVCNTLVNMYSNSAALAEAKQVFEGLPFRDVVAWNAMIKGYGQNHQIDMAVKCFETMEEQGVKPNAVTFMSLFAACGHTSLVHEGQAYFQHMREKHEIEPTLNHYLCMVDLLARSGNVCEAERFLEAMDCRPADIILNALLSACKIHGSVVPGQKCFQKLVKLNQKDAVAYLLMAEVYCSVGLKRNASQLEKMREQAGMKKKPGNAFIEIGKDVWEFSVGVKLSKDLAWMLEGLCSCLKHEGYMPVLDFIVKYLSDTEESMCCNTSQDNFGQLQ